MAPFMDESSPLSTRPWRTEGAAHGTRRDACPRGNLELFPKMQLECRANEAPVDVTSAVHTHPQAVTYFAEPNEGHASNAGALVQGQWLVP